MRIAVDIGHPAHVHYFKRLIHDLRAEGHDFLVTARERGEVFALLEAYEIPFVSRGRGGVGRLGKALNLPRATLSVYRAARRFRPDLAVSFASMYAAQAAAALRVPHIAFDDTEFVRAGQLLYQPFTAVVLSPWCFRQDFGHRHLRFRGFMELAYLGPEGFTPSETVRQELGLEGGQQYAVVRFNAFDAIHDTNISGFSPENRIRLVTELGSHVRVFVSAEGAPPSGLMSYRLPTRPERIHDVMAGASLFVGESGTMAVEAACLGTKAVRCDSFAGARFDRGNFIQFEQTYGLLSNFHSQDQERAIDEAVGFVANPGRAADTASRRAKLLEDTVDVAAFMKWFVSHYPASAKEMRADPGTDVRRFGRRAGTA